MIQPAIFAPMAGGLGDILQYYLDGEFGYFPALKRVGVTLAVKLWSVSNKAPDLFSYHPAVDHILTQPFAHVARLTDGFRPFAARTEKKFRLMSEPERRCAPWERQPFYLSPDELRMASEIEARAPYIAVHPFAGGPDRSLVKAGIARTIVNVAADSFPVVVLGGNSNRNSGVPISVFEKFEDDECYPNVINLVNKGSVRLHAHVASKAAKFIGSVSAYNCVAHSCDVPALVFGSANNRRDMKVGSSVFKKMRDKRTPIHYLDQAPDVATIVREFCG